MDVLNKAKSNLKEMWPLHSCVLLMVRLKANMNETQSDVVGNGREFNSRTFILGFVVGSIAVGLVAGFCFMYIKSGLPMVQTSYMSEIPTVETLTSFAETEPPVDPMTTPYPMLSLPMDGWVESKILSNATIKHPKDYFVTDKEVGVKNGVNCDLFDWKSYNLIYQRVNDGFVHDLFVKEEKIADNLYRVTVELVNATPEGSDGDIRIRYKLIEKTGTQWGVYCDNVDEKGRPVVETVLSTITFR